MLPLNSGYSKIKRVLVVLCTFNKTTRHLRLFYTLRYGSCIPFHCISFDLHLHNNRLVLITSLFICSDALKVVRGHIYTLTHPHAQTRRVGFPLPGDWLPLTGTLFASVLYLKATHELIFMYTWTIQGGWNHARFSATLQSEVSSQLFQTRNPEELHHMQSITNLRRQRRVTHSTITQSRT